MADPQPPPPSDPERGTPSEPLQLPDRRLWLATEPAASGSAGERWLPPLLQALRRWPAIQRLLAPDQASFPPGQRTTGAFLQRLLSRLGLLSKGGLAGPHGEGYPPVAMPLVPDATDAEPEAKDTPWWQSAQRSDVRPLGQSAPTGASASPAAAFATAAFNRATAPVRGGPPPQAGYTTPNLHLALDDPSLPTSATSPARPPTLSSQAVPADTIPLGPSTVLTTREVGASGDSGAPTTVGNGPAAPGGQAPVQPLAYPESANRPEPPSAGDSGVQPFSASLATPDAPADSAGDMGSMTAPTPPATQPRATHSTAGSPAPTAPSTLPAVDVTVERPSIAGEAATTAGGPVTPAVFQPAAPQQRQVLPTEAGQGQSVSQPQSVPDGLEPPARAEHVASAPTDPSAPADGQPSSTKVAAAEPSAGMPDRPAGVDRGQSVSADLGLDAASLQRQTLDNTAAAGTPDGRPLVDPAPDAPANDRSADAPREPGTPAQRAALRAPTGQDEAFEPIQRRAAQSAAAQAVTIVVDWVAGHDQAGLREQIAEAATVAADLEARGLTVRIERGQPVVPERHSQGEARAAADYTLWTGAGGPVSLSGLTILEGSSLVAQRPGRLRVIAAPALTRGAGSRRAVQRLPDLIFATDPGAAEASLLDGGAHPQLLRPQASAQSPVPAPGVAQPQAAPPASSSSAVGGTAPVPGSSHTAPVAQPSRGLPAGDAATGAADRPSSSAAGSIPAPASSPAASAHSPVVGPTPQAAPAAPLERASGTSAVPPATTAETAATTAGNSGTRSLQPASESAFLPAAPPVSAGAGTAGAPGAGPQQTLAAAQRSPSPDTGAMPSSPAIGLSASVIGTGSLAVAPTLGPRLTSPVAWDRAGADLSLVREANDTTASPWDEAQGRRGVVGGAAQHRLTDRVGNADGPVTGQPVQALASQRPLPNGDPIARLTAMLLHSGPTPHQVTASWAPTDAPYAAVTELALPHVLDSGPYSLEEQGPRLQRQVGQAPAPGMTDAPPGQTPPAPTQPSTPVAPPAPAAAGMPAAAGLPSASPLPDTPQANPPEAAPAAGTVLPDGLSAGRPAAGAQGGPAATPLPMPLVRADAVDALQQEARGTTDLDSTPERAPAAAALTGTSGTQPASPRVSAGPTQPATPPPSVQAQVAGTSPAPSPEPAAGHPGAPEHRASAAAAGDGTPMGVGRAAETITITLDWSPGADPWALPGVMDQAAAATAPLAVLGLRVRFVRGREVQSAVGDVLAQASAGSPPLALYGPQGLVPLENVAVLQGATVLHATPSAARVRVARAPALGDTPVVVRRPLGSPAHEALQLVHVTVDWPQGAADPWRTGTPPALPPDVVRRLADQGVRVVLQPGRAVAVAEVPAAAPQRLSVPTPTGQVLLPDIPWLAPPAAGATSDEPRFTLRPALTAAAGALPGPLQLLAGHRQTDDAAPWSTAPRWPDAFASPAEPTPLSPGAAAMSAASDQPGAQSVAGRATSLDRTGAPEAWAGVTPAIRPVSPFTESQNPVIPAGAPQPPGGGAAALPVTPSPFGEQAAAWLSGDAASPGPTVTARWSLKALQRLMGAEASGAALARQYRPLGMNVVYYETDRDVPDGGLTSGRAQSEAWRPLPLQQLPAALDALGARPVTSPAGGEQWDRQAFIFAEDAPPAPPAIDPAAVAAAATGRGEAPAPVDHTAVTTTVQTAKKDVKEDKHEHPNVDVLARQVYAVIRQRLAVERERAGRRDRW